jgi:hypothetical protein
MRLEDAFHAFTLTRTLTTTVSPGAKSGMSFFSCAASNSSMILLIIFRPS